MMHHISDQEYCQLIEAEISRTESVIIKKALFNKAILKKCVISFILCCIGDLWSSFDHYAITHDWIYTQIATGLISQAIWLTSGFLFFDAADKKERIAIGISNALGFSVGSTLMLMYLKPFFNSFF